MSTLFGAHSAVGGSCRRPLPAPWNRALDTYGHEMELQNQFQVEINPYVFAIAAAFGLLADRWPHLYNAMSCADSSRGAPDSSDEERDRVYADNSADDSRSRGTIQSVPLVLASEERASGVK